jgi:AAA15 family ATPase/GTPase
MLIEFSVSNFLSFKEKATLSMVASKDDWLRHWVVESAHGSKYNLLKAAVIYGPNGSGKSNFMKALSFMRTFIINSAQKAGPESPITVSPYKLEEPYDSRPSEFEIMFIHEGVSYEYGFMVDRTKVHREWLFSFPKGQIRKLFERSAKGIKFGPHWKGGGKRLVEYTRGNALFLSTAAQFNHQKAKSLLGWFENELLDISPENSLDELFGVDGRTDLLLESFPQLKEKILRFLAGADLGISDFISRKRPIKDDSSELPEELRTLFRQMESRLYDVTVMHQGKNLKRKPQIVKLDFKDESKGTQKIYNLSGPWLAVLKEAAILLADEFDVRLHPNLARWLIEMFLSKKTNPKGAQLIMTSHDSALLDRSLFRRDQIWFTEKDESGASRLYSLWDFKARKDENIRGGYLVGRYGAVPFLDHIHDGV